MLHLAAINSHHSASSQDCSIAQSRISLVASCCDAGGDDDDGDNGDDDIG